MKNGRTALHCAAQKGQADVVQLLLDRGASVHTEDRNKRTALRVAELHGHSDIVHLLLNKGAQPVLLDSILCSDFI
jgi:ankyrin repeat protein